MPALKEILVRCKKWNEVENLVSLTAVRWRHYVPSKGREPKSLRDVPEDPIKQNNSSSNTTKTTTTITRLWSNNSNSSSTKNNEDVEQQQQKQHKKKTSLWRSSSSNNNKAVEASNLAWSKTD